MNHISKLLLGVCLSFVFFCNAQTDARKFQMHTIAFYNVENLFDTDDDPNTNDDVKTPAWYAQKLKNLERVISEIGTTDQHQNGPIVLGVCEIENRRVLEDLVNTPKLKAKGYKVIHGDSPDGRGIDNAFLYQEKHFKPTSYAYINPRVPRREDPGKFLKTRDILLVSGLLDGEEVHFIVNHWPSRSGGEKRSSPGRERAGQANREIIDSLFKINPMAKIMTMGDLNDGPFNKSVKVELRTVPKRAEMKPDLMYNPMEEMSKKGIGTLAYRDAWDLFDQIILSYAWTKDDYSSWRYFKAGVYNRPYMVQTSGRYKGYPLRNSDAEPGFSDHFPVYVHIIKEVK
jgi:hypothetical protein